ncbi:venom dipeptidyl peptidase 4-like [Culicoides brevitarsis]|uniref:venom dipeptidyl peptidase 4-like n=1 Tax=Culicoides brevitarsis TaxID=469753 RepID=UPI00307C1986
MAFGKAVLLCFLVLGVSLTSATPRHHRGKGLRNLKPVRLEDVIPNKFGQRGFNGTWVANDAFTYYDVDRNLMKMDLVSNQHERLLGFDVLKQWNATSTKMNKQQTRLLLRYADRPVFRHSILAKYVVYDLEQRLAIDVAGQNELWECTWSPTGDAIAYVKQDNNVYYYSLTTKQEMQVTTDGLVVDNSGIIYNGISDWVYEEEVFSTKNGMWFSPNGKYLAMVHLDDTHVHNFTYNIYGAPGTIESQYPAEITLRYPKSGTPNPTVELRVIDLEQFTAFVTYKAPPALGSEPILGSVSWINDKVFAPMWLNRRQNHALFVSCDASKARADCLTLHEKSEPNGWVDVTSLDCHTIETKEICFFKENQNGWTRLMELNYVSKEIRALSPTLTTVLQIKGYHKETNEVYFVATGIAIDEITNPALQHLYVYDRKSSQVKCVSCEILSPEGDKCSFVSSVTFSNDFNFFAVTCGGPGPAYVRIMRNGAVLRALDLWEGNWGVRQLLGEYQKTRVMYLRVPVGPKKEHSAIVKLQLPSCFEQGAKRKYPMIVDVYGGPGSVRIQDSFSMGFGDYMAQSKNVIYAKIDGRGSGNKGTEMLFTVNNALGSVEIEDQIEVTKALVAELGFIDADRVGIWGWSYGGYATGMTLVMDKEKVFQGGISVAPVSSWIYYDTIYTERFMGTPEENPVGYEKGDLTQRAKDMKGHEYLLIHGNADDNVHYQQAMVWARALELEDVLFEQQSYPDEAHGLNGVSKHLYHTMDEFWHRILKLTKADETCEQAKSYWKWF